MRREVGHSNSSPSVSTWISKYFQTPRSSVPDSEGRRNGLEQGPDMLELDHMPNTGANCDDPSSPPFPCIHEWHQWQRGRVVRVPMPRVPPDQLTCANLSVPTSLGVPHGVRRQAAAKATRALRVVGSDIVTMRAGDVVGTARVQCRDPMGGAARHFKHAL
mmetsp:Transcript_59728/g.106583  ORF Transcript_59728/g.106583 Transcript_59728/m.106583 type:complete len:161 (-) Transcript_59728:274-756(-)